MFYFLFTLFYTTWTRSFKSSYNSNTKWTISCTPQLLFDRDSARVTNITRKNKKFPTKWEKTVPIMQFHHIKLFIHWKLKESASQVTKKPHTTACLCCSLVLNSAPNPEHWEKIMIQEKDSSRLWEKKIQRGLCFFLLFHLTDFTVHIFMFFHNERARDYWHLKN